jgi:hypothetical protein
MSSNIDLREIALSRTMNTRELVHHIQSGPAELVLFQPLRFRRRTRSNPCDFNDFLRALQSSETIRTVKCESHAELGIKEDEWILLVKTLGSIKGIQNLRFNCVSGSHNFHPFQAFADAVNDAKLLRKLIFVLDPESFSRDPFGLSALANALREHSALKIFSWSEFGSRQREAGMYGFLQTQAGLFGSRQREAGPFGTQQQELLPRAVTPNPVLQALPDCPNLRSVTVATKHASPITVRSLLQLPMVKVLLLILETEQWFAVADEIRQGRCHVKNLALGMVQSSSAEATEAVKALASAIRLDRNLEHLTLRMENGFTDEAGVALAEALTVNKTLRIIKVGDTLRPDYHVRNRDKLGAPAYEALSAMLRVNTGIRVGLPKSRTAGSDERLRESRRQMIIEQRLNLVGRGKLLESSQNIREEWVNALHELNVANASPAHIVSCQYSLLRLNPAAVCA